MYVPGLMIVIMIVIMGRVVFMCRGMGMFLLMVVIVFVLMCGVYGRPATRYGDSEDCRQQKYTLHLD